MKISARTERRDWNALTRDTSRLPDHRITHEYDELPLWSAPFGLMLLEFIDLRATAVLDIGCGTGFPALELAERLGPTAHVDGIDIWDEALERARFKAERWGVRNVTFTKANASSLPFDDARFDLIVSNLGLNNFAERNVVLAECRRVLKRGAKLSLTTNLEGHMQQFYDVFEATLQEANEAAAIAALRKEVARRGTVQSLGDDLLESGFTVTRSETRSITMRFASGTALFAHHFIRLGFMDGWQRIVPAERQLAIFAELENRLDRLAGVRGTLDLTIPMAYVEAIC